MNSLSTCITTRVIQFNKKFGPEYNAIIKLSDHHSITDYILVTRHGDKAFGTVGPQRLDDFNKYINDIENGRLYHQLSAADKVLYGK